MLLFYYKTKSLIKCFIFDLIANFLYCISQRRTCHEGNNGTTACGDQGENYEIHEDWLFCQPYSDCSLWNRLVSMWIKTNRRSLTKSSRFFKCKFDCVHTLKQISQRCIQTFQPLIHRPHAWCYHTCQTLSAYFSHFINQM